MLFWFKKKEVVLDCFTYLNYAYNIIPIEKAVRYIPDWFKKLKQTNLNDFNSPPFISMKSCPGFKDYFSNSFALPMWDHAHFRVTKDDLAIFSESIPFKSHPPGQYGDLLDPTYTEFKFITPWFITSKSNTKFIQTFPMWCYQARHKPEKILHCPGVIDFKTQYSTNVNFFFKHPNEDEKDYVVTFEPGIPLAFFTPLDDVKVNIKNHLITQQEFDQRKSALGSTPAINRYYTYKKLIEKRDEDKKCPLGFK